VEVTGVAENCAVDRPRRSVQVLEPALAMLHFTATCTGLPLLGGARIAYVRQACAVERDCMQPAGSVTSIVAMNGDGSLLTPLASDDYYEAPSVSPDGKRIVFAGDRDGDPRRSLTSLYAMNADGSDLEQLTESYAYTPRWSADGRVIVFSTPDDDSTGSIMAVQADGSGLRRIASGIPYLWAPVLSPDGSRIAFLASHVPGQASSVWVVNADGSGLTALTDPDPGLGSGVAWTADGRHITYSVSEERPGGRVGGSKIKLLEVDSSERSDLLETELGPVKVGDWSRDGRTPLFTRGRDVFALHLPDRALVRLTAEHTGWSENASFVAQP
jgi:dipeptidyl aminopeptidase/acylaminoacyl peptidase